MKPGFYPSSEISMGQYLADPAPDPSLSSGAAHDLLMKSPAHVFARHPRLGGAPTENSDAMDTGTIAHELLLGGDSRICEIRREDYRSKPTKDNPEGAVPTGWTNNAIREARDAARASGLIPVLREDMIAYHQMAQAAREFVSRSEIAGVLDGAFESEVTQIWREGEAWCRARHDGINHELKIRLSFKTTQQSANPDAFIRSMYSMGYDLALAFYRRGFEAIAGVQEGWRDVILVQEQRAPHACSLVSLDPAAWAIADQKVERAILLWRRCMLRNEWHGYSGMIAYASPTPWQLAESEALGGESE
jgi:hypothetical protein